MADEPSSDLIFAINSQDKFEQYLIALTFTVLALSIQSVHFGINPWANAAELLAWLLLLASGFFGLGRWRATAGIYATYDAQKGFKNIARMAAEASRSGIEFTLTSHGKPVGMSMEDFLKGAMTKLDSHQEKANASVARRFTAQKWMLGFGMLLLVGARAYTPLALMSRHIGCPALLVVQIDPTARIVSWDSTTHARLQSAVGGCIPIHRNASLSDDSTTRYHIPITVVVRGDYSNPFARISIKGEELKRAVVLFELLGKGGVVLKADSITYQLSNSPNGTRMSSAATYVSADELAQVALVRVGFSSIAY